MLGAPSKLPPPAAGALYCGRFAPSPTGPLHFGSMVAALASYLDARSQGGRWLVRIEDVDAPRARMQEAAGILRTLERFGLTWDGEVVYQRARMRLYEGALERLAGLTFGCACSRKDITDSLLRLESLARADAAEGGETDAAAPAALLAPWAAGERRYPGTCRAGLAAGRTLRAIRVRVDDEPLGFEDAIQGRIEQNLSRDIGDFIVQRADGVFAYQLAVVVDDGEQGVTDVVRGADLLPSTPRQIYLQRVLGLQTPRYKHVPVATTRAGEKLSKQTRARPVGNEHAPDTLVKALEFLGQEPPPALLREPAETVLRWGIEHWSVARIPRVAGRTVTAEGALRGAL